MKRIAASLKFKLAFAIVAATGLAAAQQNPILNERAYQDREILYELQEPQSHAFRITHDYTERKEGEKHYFNVVRAGSRVSEFKLCLMAACRFTSSTLATTMFESTCAPAAALRVDPTLNPTILRQLSGKYCVDPQTATALIGFSPAQLLPTS